MRNSLVSSFLIICLGKVKDKQNPFVKTCAGLGIEQAFSAYNNPKGNADTERIMRTLKEDIC